ncbi:hypothetical protein LX32DRAFT_261023 [Colletotrichum zoysiae]|uniref:Uncharacterized protein n=1 Tax=Colletotrichum zoysiae TaxID=1216348 RepID=A0AAD9LU53_9PEZI|nr:hypothetical protein LX32DRAFT_261023 [Colletotrichum zoysiae]
MPAYLRSIHSYTHTRLHALRESRILCPPARPPLPPVQSMPHVSTRASSRPWPSPASERFKRRCKPAPRCRRGTVHGVPSAVRLLVTQQRPSLLSPSLPYSVLHSSSIHCSRVHGMQRQNRRRPCCALHCTAPTETSADTSVSTDVRPGKAKPTLLLCITYVPPYTSYGTVR